MVEQVKQKQSQLNPSLALLLLGCSRWCGVIGCACDDHPNALYIFLLEV